MAKGIIANFLVKVTSNGLGKAKSDVDALGKSTQKVAEAHGVAEVAARRHFNTQEKGVIGTANGTKNFSKMAQTMNGGGGVVGAYATLAANIFAVSAAFNALKGAAQVQQLERGLEALGNRTGQTLSIAADGLRDVTGAAISTEQALRSSAQVFSAGFNTEQLNRLGKVANDASFALGRSMTDSMDRLTRGVIKLEPELLDELGIMTRLGDATKAYATELGKSESALTTVERRQAFYNAVMAEGEAKFGGLAAKAGNTKAFDVLGATISDLSKTTLNFLNQAALPLASMFATSPLALVGGGLLFAATIKNQLLPGLGNLTKAASETAEEMVKLSKEQASALAADAAPRSFVNRNNTKNDVLAKTYAQIAKGDFDQVDKAINISTESIKKYGAEIDKLRADPFTEITRATIQKNKEEITLHKASIQRLSELKAAQAGATAQTQASNAIGAASTNQYKFAMESLKTSILSYTASQTIANTSTAMSARLMIATRVAAFSASVGVRVLGAAFLNMIPIIGQIVLVVGLVIAALKSMESQESKNLGKATKEFGIVVGALGGKFEELTRINNSAAPAAVRVQQALQLEANALTEVAEKYEALKKAREATADVDDESTNNIARWWETWTMRGMASNRAQIRENSKAIDTLLPKDNAFDRAFGGSQANIEAMQLFATLETGAPEALAEVMKLNKGFEGMEISEVRKALEEELSKVAKATKLASDTINNLIDTQKAAGTSMADFIKSATPTTPFDKVAADLTQYNKAIEETNKQVRAGVLDSQKLVDAMSGIPDSLASMLSLSTAQYVEDTNLVTKLTQLGKEITPFQQIQLEMAKDRLAVNQSGVETLQQELQTMESQFKLAQQSVILAQSENTILNARAKASQDNMNLTAVGLAQRMKLDNQIIENNKKALEQQKLALKAQMEQRNLRIENLNLQIKELEIAKAAFIQTQQANIEQRRQWLEEDRRAETRRGANPYERSRATEARVRNETFLASAEADLTNRTKAYDESIRNSQASIVALKEDNRVISMGILAVSNEINALELSQLSAAEQAIRIREKQFEIDKERSGQLRAALGMTQEAARADQKRLILQQQGKLSLTDEANIARDIYEDQREALTVAQEQNRQQIIIAREKADSDKRDEASRAAAVRHWNEQLNIADLTGQAELARLDATYKLEELERMIFDTRKEGLDWQRDSLEYVQKQLDAERQLRETLAKQSELREDLALRRNGLVATESTAEAREIRAATMAYELARDEVSIKKAMIDLEYALLDAQREVLAEEIRARRDYFNDNNEGGKFDLRIAQLDRTIQTLTNVNTDRIAEQLKRSLDEQVENSRMELEIASGRNGNTGNRLRNELAGLRALFAAKDRAAEALRAQVANDNTFSVVRPVAEVSSEERRANASISSTASLVTSNGQLIQTISELIETIETTTRAPARPSVTNGAVNARQAASMWGTELNSRGGIRADEHPDHGRVTPGAHRGRGHAEGRALDVNVIPQGRETNVDADNPRMARILDNLKTELETLYGDNVKVLWRTAGHFNHMHVEFVRGFEQQVEAMEVIARAGAAQASAAVDEVTNLSDVTVTARRQAPAEVLNPEAMVDLQPLTARIPEVLSQTEQLILKGEYAVQLFGILSGDIRKGFESLGPEGEAVLAAMSGIETISSAVFTMMQAFDTTKTGNPLVDFENRFSAISGVASAALATIQSVTAASSDAKIAAIDREIAAEQKRDGKSAESVAKIQALERKKEAAAKKAFEVNKKLMMAQAIMSTAAAVVGALAAPPLPGSPFNIAMAAAMGALGAAQLAIISGTSYQSTSSPGTQVATSPPSLSIGKRGDSVDLARNNANAGGEIGYLRGQAGMGRSSADYSVIGSAYGGNAPRGYGNTAYLVGEHGPETITPETPITVRPVNDNEANRPMPPVNFNINALDAKGVEEILHGRRGYIIGMLREAANANGQTFLEDVNTAVYTKPNVSRL